MKGDPQARSDKQYVKRGDMENRIKERQLMLFSGRTSCHDLEANKFRLLLSTFAYVLFQHLRQDHVAGRELACVQANTIRPKLLKVVARVIVSVRRVLFHLASSYPYESVSRRIAQSLLLRPG